MNAIRGTRYLSACRQTVSLWASTPSRALKTTTPPSSTRRLRSTSAVKSTWPGVSIRLIVHVLPGERDAGRVDRDAALLLLGVEVGDGGALVDLAHAVAEAAVVQHPLGDGGLAGVDVGDDADVAELFELACHRIPRIRPAERAATGELSMENDRAVMRDQVIEARGHCCRRRAHGNAAPERCSRAAQVVRDVSTYQAKWANALLASAMRWTFSRLVMAAPSRL